jgi:rhomboid family GlyGly-CTERM serine protease
MMSLTFIRTGILLSMLLIVFQFIQTDLLFLRDNIQQGQLWRIWTGNLVHSNYYHLALNLAGFWLFLFIFKDLMNATQLLVTLILLISGVGLGLYFLNPTLYWYAGFSGALYGLYIIGATYALIKKDIITGLTIISVIPTKIIWDHLNATGQTNAELIGVPVSTDAHIYGISSAFLISICIFTQHYWRKT